jgi:hypothetical protein
VEKTEHCKSIFIDQGKNRYEIVAPATLIPRSGPEPHAGEWVARVTIYKTSNDEPSKAQSFHNDSQYGATEDEARSKGHDYGRKLVLGAIDGLTI